MEIRLDDRQPIGVDYSNVDDKIKLVELFWAPQGEGIYTGQPSIFVRFAGCSVMCHYCDVKESWRVAQGHIFDPNELVHHLINHPTGCKNVVITGGEPLDHPPLTVLKFMEGLLKSGFRITVETSGLGHPDFDPSMFILSLPRHAPILWSIAPKLEFAGARRALPNDVLDSWLRESHYRDHRSQVKFVVQSPDHVIEANRIVRSLLSVEAPEAIILQPMSPTKPGRSEADVRQDIIDAVKSLHEYIRTSNLMMTTLHNFRVLPQLHAILHGYKHGI